LLLLAFLLPLALYLFVLAHVNRRPRAVMVSGPWDFAGVLFAASGFLLFGGPALLSSLSLNDTWRRFWLLGRDRPGLTQEDLLLTVRIVLFALYFVVVVGGAALLLWRRRRLTAIYNVDPAVVETVLGQTLERWQVPFVQTGNVLVFEPDAAPAVSSEPGPPGPPARAWTLEQRPPVALLDRAATLEVAAGPAMCHVTLRWDLPDSRLRREVEGQLRRALEETPAPASAVGEWLLIIAYTLFFVALLGLTVLALFWIFRR